MARLGMELAVDFGADKEYSELKRAGSSRLDTNSIGATPLVTLIKQLAARPQIRSFSLTSAKALMLHLEECRHE